MDLIAPPSELTQELNPGSPETQSQENSDTISKLSGSSEIDKSGISTETTATTMPDSQDSVTSTDETKITNDSEVLDTGSSVENVNSAEDNSRTIDNSDKLNPTDEQVNANEIEDSLKCINTSVSEINQVREPESLTEDAAVTTDSPVSANAEINESENIKSPVTEETETEIIEEKKDEPAIEEPMELDEGIKNVPDNANEPEKMDIDESSVEKPIEQVDSVQDELEDNDKKESSIENEITQEETDKEQQKNNEASIEDLPDTEDNQQQANDALSETDDQEMQQENPVFVHVNTKDGEGDNDKTANSDVDQSETGDESLEATCLNEEDPIGITQEGDKDVLMDFSEDGNEKETLKVVDFNEVSEKSQMDDEALNASKGADEELCIIPDTEREISQEEKDAARAAAAAAVEKTTSEVKSTETETAKVAEDSTDKPESVVASAEASDPKVPADKSAESVAEALSQSDSELLNSGLPENNHESSEPVERPDGIKVKDIPEDKQTEESCHQCCNRRKAIFEVEDQEKPTYLCSDTCLLSFRTLNKSVPEAAKSKTLQSKNVEKTVPETSASTESNKIFVRKCSECSLPINSADEKILSWETMDFCNEDCLSKYQNTIGSHCANCKEEVLMSSLGKYCVRFGHDIRQFCCSNCLEEFKKGLKVCSYCQKDISGGQEGFLAPVGDKGQFKDFCTQLCMDKYEQMSNKNSVKKAPAESALCSVCLQDKTVNVLFEQFDAKHKFCSEPCFIAYKYVNNVNPLHCEMCKNYFENVNTTQFSIYYDNLMKNFCSKTCQNIYIIANRRIVPCSWCKVKKYNFDMIRKVCSNGQILMMCSLNCLSLFQVSISAVSTKRMKCDHCSKISQAQYHLTMSDATIRNFCAYPCVMAFQNQFSKLPITLNTPAAASASVETPKTITTRSVSSAVPASGPKRYQNRARAVANDATASEVQLPVITNVQSLASPATNGPTSAPITRGAHKINNQQQTAPQPIPVPIPQYKQQVIVKAPPLPPMRNAATSCKPIMHTKGVSCRPHPCSKETQTDEIKEKTVLVPVPVPIYIPAPAHMYSAPVPVPIPFPIPIPVPIFIPTTRNSAAGIMKEIKKIQVKIPTDPFEAELLMMAEMVAGEKKVENTDSESEDDDPADTGNDGGFSPEAVDTSNTFGDDMLQMALKMATELDEPAVDLEGALTANTITASQTQDQTGVVPTEEAVDDPQPMHPLMDRNQAMRGRKRPNRQPRNMNAAKRGRRMSQHVEMPLLPPPPPQQPPEPIEKPDANMCLKYTFGVNAWKQWVTTKNAELEKSSRRVKLFKNEILQLTADELNYSLCLFVKEVRKPNGTEYAPDTIYYLCLGIQQYLFENGRIDNIFTDAYYEKFTDCLDEVARKFSVLYNDSHYIVTRVEEEHLWESKQLGAHSPHVLLSTLMFFNTKHFNLTTVDEHMQLSFSHIMKHWKRNPNQPGAAKIPGSRNVLLRFYPPQTTLDSNSRKKKVYEQQENEENPLRCPVKLYEFYLSKCPESVKTRNDVFYLLPERSCVPDSPVWYSTMALGREALEKMLHRVKMVKEINVALLTMD